MGQFFCSLYASLSDIYIYSDPKNRFMKGKNLLVRQIVAQQTKVKVWEIVGTKINILSFAMPKYITLGLVFNLIPILQSHHLNESVFLLCTQLCIFGLYHSPYPLRGALN